MLLMVTADGLSAVEIDTSNFRKQNTLIFQTSELSFRIDILVEL
jgi:hypothetical protein